jgi:hypothetical protein
LLSRSRKIFACSSAAVRSSSAVEFASRVRSSPSIASAERPVAHTMKMKPCFASYSRLSFASSSLMPAAAAATARCSSRDHFCVVSASTGGFDSPIFGCAANASR